MVNYCDGYCYSEDSKQHRFKVKKTLFTNNCWHIGPKIYFTFINSQDAVGFVSTTDVYEFIHKKIVVATKARI